jgi:hypothetical protein
MLMIAFFVFTMNTKGQTQRIDLTAVFLLHRTGETLQDIKFCNFMEDINYDISNESLVTIKTLNNRKKSTRQNTG